MLGLGHAVQGTHAGVLGCAVMSLVVVFVVVVLSENFVSDYHVVHTVDNLAASVACDKETAADVAAGLKMLADFPVIKQVVKHAMSGQ